MRKWFGGVPAEDAALIVGASMRATRLVVADAVPGRWWIKEPIDRAMESYERYEMLEAKLEEREVRQPWWWRYRSGLDCPHCVGLWISGAVVGSYVLARRSPLTLAAWRVGAAALTANLVSTLVGGQFDYFDDPEQEEQS